MKRTKSKSKFFGVLGKILGFLIWIAAILGVFALMKLLVVYLF